MSKSQGSEQDCCGVTGGPWSGVMSALGKGDCIEDKVAERLLLFPVFTDSFLVIPRGQQDVARAL